MITPIFKQAGLSPDTVKFIIVESNELNAFVAGGQMLLGPVGDGLKNMQEQLVAERHVLAGTKHAFVDDLPEKMHCLIVGF